MSNSDSLDQALERYQIALPDQQREQIDNYCKLLWTQNQHLNLTRHSDYETFVARDLIDSMELAKHFGESERVLDVGSGGGVPGILLAILRPDLQLVLCDGVGKKAKALGAMINSLNLPTPVVKGRAEEIVLSTPFDTLTGRAIGPLWKILRWFEPCWDHFGRLVLIKGPKWLDERNEARHRGFLKPLEMRRIDEYPMPGRDGNSVILMVWAKNSAWTGEVTFIEFKSDESKSDGLEDESKTRGAE